MDITVFLASIWGPTILAMGAGLVMNPAFYIRLYRDIEKEVFASIVFGMLAIAIGIMQIQYHNAWGTFPQIVVSLLGWGTLVKGAMFVLAPSLVDQAGDWWGTRSKLPVIAALMCVFGAYLTWFAYLA